MKVQYMKTRLKKNRAKLNRMHSAERDQWRNVIESCCEAADIVSYPGGVHKLLPVSLSNGRVLQLVDGSQRGQQVLHRRLQTHVDVPHPHLLIQHLHLLQCVRYSCSRKRLTLLLYPRKNMTSYLSVEDQHTLANRLSSMSICSTLISFHGVLVQSSILV